MLTNEDIQKLIDIFATKEEIKEMIALSHKVDRHEKWFHQVADKLGIKLEY